MRLLLGTVAHLQHVQDIARALFERQWLGEYRTGGVDVWQSGWTRALRRRIGQVYPRIDSRLARRRIADVPESLVSSDWRWEAPRLVANRLGLPYLEDWLWERSEHSIDRWCASRIGRPEFDGFVGVEHGALRTLARAKKLGKPGIVAFLSPHHATRAEWVDAEYERFPDLLTPGTRRLLKQGHARDDRRDEEARISDIILAASRFTCASLVAAGLPREKILVTPPGCPESPSGSLQSARPRTVRFLYSGPVSVRKGAHLLLDAWRMLKPGTAAELHFFGAVLLPPRCLVDLGTGVHFHGSVSSEQMTKEYRAASVLVFPTLCDGFGAVVAEALSAGLPVITTPNAGAADLIREGQNGWLVAPRDAGALAERMQFCLDRPTSLDSMRETAAATAASWTSKHFREAFISQLAAALSYRELIKPAVA